jgi:hypothetical protein
MLPPPTLRQDRHRRGKSRKRPSRPRGRHANRGSSVQHAPACLNGRPVLAGQPLPLGLPSAERLDPQPLAVDHEADIAAR